jgi:hypothetical protein
VALTVAEYLRWARQQTIPPFCLEIVTRSGKSYWVKNVFDHFDEGGLFAVRVWDFRMVPEADLAAVLAAFNRLDRRGPFVPTDVHPGLDQANLWLRVDDIDHLVEWHERLWPEPAPEGTERAPIGFQARQPEGQQGASPGDGG